MFKKCPFIQPWNLNWVITTAAGEVVKLEFCAWEIKHMVKVKTDEKYVFIVVDRIAWFHKCPGKTLKIKYNCFF
jgi:hypothetical protein